MNEKQKSIVKGWPVYLFLVVLIALMMAYMVKNPDNNKSLPNKIADNLEAYGNVNLEKMLEIMPEQMMIMTDWYGKEAPDFSISDINGGPHKLSDYKGKEVMLVVWATWCRWCKTEIPELIELQNELDSDKFAILAVSFENEYIVKDYINGRGDVNYPILLGKEYMEQPYTGIQQLPAAIFIDPDGKIKVITLGAMEKKQMNALITAK